jgi:hypothetical protein
VIRSILDHPGIWLVRSRPPPKTHDPPVCIHKTDRLAAYFLLEKPIKGYTLKFAVRAIVGNYIRFAKRLLHNPNYAKTVADI